LDQSSKISIIKDSASLFKDERKLRLPRRSEKLIRNRTNKKVAKSLNERVHFFDDKAGNENM